MTYNAAAHNGHPDDGHRYAYCAGCAPSVPESVPATPLWCGDLTPHRAHQMVAVERSCPGHKPVATPAADGLDAERLARATWNTETARSAQEAYPFDEIQDHAKTRRLVRAEQIATEYARLPSPGAAATPKGAGDFGHVIAQDYDDD